MSGEKHQLLNTTEAKTANSFPSWDMSEIFGEGSIAEESTQSLLDHEAKAAAPKITEDFDRAFQEIYKDISTSTLDKVIARPNTPEAKEIKTTLSQLKNELSALPASQAISLFLAKIKDSQITNSPAKIYCAIEALRTDSTLPAAQQIKLSAYSDSFLNLAVQLKAESKDLSGVSGAFELPEEESSDDTLTLPKKTASTQKAEPEQKSIRTKQIDFLSHTGFSNDRLKERSMFELQGPERLRKLHEATYVMRNGALPDNSHDKAGHSILIYLIFNGFSFLFRDFLHLNNPNLRHTDNNGLHALGWAVSYKGNSFIAHELIKYICMRGELDLLDLLNINSRTTALIIAAGWGYLDIIKLLLEAGASLELIDKSGKTALDWAIQKKHTHVVEFIKEYQRLGTLTKEESKSSPKDSKENQGTPLLTPQQSFLRFGLVNPKSTLVEQIEWQKEQETLYKERTHIERTAEKLIAAIKDNHQSYLKEIFEPAQKAKEIMNNKDNETEGNIASATKILQDMEKIVNYVDNRGQTPWFYAVRENHAEAMTLLIQYGADINKLDSIRNETALESTVLSGLTESIETLFSPLIQTQLALKRTQLELEAKESKEDTPEILAARRLALKNTYLNLETINLRNGSALLTQAAHSADLELTIALLAAGADCQVQNVRHNTPLQVAEQYTDDSALEKKRAKVAACLRELQAAQAQELPVLAAEVGAVLADIWSAEERKAPTRLIAEYLGGHMPTSFLNKVNEERSKKLMALARPKVKTENKKSIFLERESYDRSENIREIKKRIERGTDLNFRDNYDKNILIYLILNGYTSLTRQVLQLSPNLIAFQDTTKTNTIHWAAASGNPSIMRALLETIQTTKQFKLIDAQNNLGLTPLMVAIEDNCLEAAKLLIGAGANFKRLPGQNGQSTYEMAKAKGQKELTDFMDAFEKLALPDEKNTKTRLSDPQRAFTHGMFTDEIPSHLQVHFQEKEFKERFEQQCRERKSQELINALKDNDREEVARLTATPKSMISAKDKEAKDVKHTTQPLGFDPHYIDHQNGDNHLIHHAAIVGDDKLVFNLIKKHNVDINAPNNGGNTALHSAAFHDHPPVIDTLLKAGADLTIRNKDGKTPLMLAKAGKRLRTADILERAEASRGISSLSEESGLKAAFARIFGSKPKATKEQEQLKEQENGKSKGNLPKPKFMAASESIN